MTAEISGMNFPARININFELPKSLLEQIVSMNAVFLNRGFSEIDFSQNSDHLPHVTLLMGEVNSRASLERIIATCGNFASRHKPLPYKTGHPYWKKPSLKFLFLDTLPLEAFRLFRLGLFSELNTDIRCEYHGGPENPSHITVGYGDSRRIPIGEIASLYSQQDSAGRELRVCETGERGTCHTVLARFHLLGAA